MGANFYLLQIFYRLKNGNQILWILNKLPEYIKTAFYNSVIIQWRCTFLVAGYQNWATVNSDNVKVGSKRYDLLSKLQILAVISFMFVGINVWNFWIPVIWDVIKQITRGT